MIRLFARRVAHAKLLRTAVALVLSGSLPTPAPGQEAPSPNEFHCYELGTRCRITAALYDYNKALATASHRVAYRVNGHCIQGPPLPMVIVGSEANLACLDDIRAAN